MLDPRDDPEKPLHHPVLAALDAQPEPLLYLDQVITSDQWEAAMRHWHGEALPQLIVEGHVIDRGPDFLAQGHMARYAYAEPEREAAHQELILRNGG